MKAKIKRYTVRFSNNGQSTITAISDYSDLMDLIKGSAVKSIIEVKISEGMPIILHNIISKHNEKVKTLNHEE